MEGQAPPSAERLLLVELADEAEREERAHVLEVRAHLHVDLVPAGVTLNLNHNNLHLIFLLLYGMLLVPYHVMLNNMEHDYDHLIYMDYISCLLTEV